MAKAKRTKPTQPAETNEVQGITKITVSGFKSIREERSIEVRPLTILAGANSSGKSSIMQPLLLLKQTLESRYDPGPLLLNGSILSFTEIEQFVTRNSNRTTPCFEIGFVTDGIYRISLRFIEREEQIAVARMRLGIGDEDYDIDANMDAAAIRDVLSRSQLRDLFQPMDGYEGSEKYEDYQVIPSVYFLDVRSRRSGFSAFGVHLHNIGSRLENLIYLRGLRGNPERYYPVSKGAPFFQGNFENYTASVLISWGEKFPESLRKLAEDLQFLALAWDIEAKRRNLAEVEIQVARLQRGSPSRDNDMVNIADVGLGVSQALPVLVALRVAKAGQIVYVEQPELHLHPKAQVAMATILANAAKRGVRVVAETHSDLILCGIQTLVAKGDLDPSLVKLHWFTRRSDGQTDITPADLDKKGAFGDWPEDFSDTVLASEGGYLDAVSNQKRGA